jgi:tetratricopeptide (TPR) repeat protein
MRTALETRVQDRKRRVVPVLLPGAPDNRDLKLPRFLTRLTWVDFRARLDDEDALYRLYCGIAGNVPGAPSEVVKADIPKGLPSGSYIPFPRNALFTGREEEIKKLSALCESGSSNIVISQAITGMGGIGKTQLAVEFAYRHGYAFKGVHWLDLRDPDALDASIALCGTHMGLAYTKQPEQVAQTLLAWQSDGSRLLILDNFEDVTKATKVLSRFQHPALRLLVTSRRRDFPKSTGLKSQELDTFSEAESAVYLSKTLEHEGAEESRKSLAEKLGHLPLALELSASYININRLEIAQYLQELEDILSHESMQEGWFKELDITTPTEHERNLLATFQLSWQEVKDETTKKVFMIAGFCAPNVPIPIEIFKQSLGVDRKSLQKAIYRLHVLGLFLYTDDLIVIHTLLAAYARKLSSFLENFLEGLVSNLAELAKRVYDSGINNGDINEFAPFQSHIYQVAQFSQENNLLDAARLFGNLGNYLSWIADYENSKAAHQRALKIRESLPECDQELIAINLNNLGGVLQKLGDYDNAKNQIEHAIKINESIFGPIHPNIALGYNNLGHLLQELGDYTGAKTATEHALFLSEILFGLNHPNVARSLNNLGSILKDLGKYAEAEAAFRRSIQIGEATVGTIHPDIAARINNLGGLLQDLGNYSEAKDAYERALYIEEAVFGPNHPNVSISLNNLGSVLTEMGKLDEATTAIKRAIKIDEFVLGPSHPIVANRYNNLGAALQEQGDYNGAKTAYDYALDICQKALDPYHPEVATYLSNKGALLQEMGEYAESIATFNRALSIDESNFGEIHPNVARDLNNLGALFNSMGNYPEAKSYYERALLIIEKTFPPDHPFYATISSNLGNILIQQNDPIGAIAAFKRALKIFKQSLPEGHSHIKIVEDNLRVLEEM